MHFPRPPYLQLTMSPGTSTRPQAAASAGTQSCLQDRRPRGARGRARSRSHRVQAGSPTGFATMSGPEAVRCLGPPPRRSARQRESQQYGYRVRQRRKGRDQDDPDRPRPLPQTGDHPPGAQPTETGHRRSDTPPHMGEATSPDGHMSPPARSRPTAYAITAGARHPWQR